MFKKSLKTQPVFVQLLILLSIWFVLMMLFVAVNQVYIELTMDIGSGEFAEFVRKDMYRFPGLVFVSNALFQIFSFLFPALIYARLADTQPLKYLGVASVRNKIHPVLVLVLAISLIFFIAPLGQWLKQIDFGTASKALDDQRDKFIQAYLSQADGWAAIRSIILIAVIPAFCEEIFFRGILMKFTKTLFKKWWISIGFSALVFAAFHTTISEFIPIFIAGVILGYVYYLTSSIWMNILLHLLFNGLQVVAVMSSNPEMEKSLDQPSVLIAVFAVAVAVVGGCMFMLIKNKTSLPESWGVVVPEIKEPEWDMDQNQL